MQGKNEQLDGGRELPYISQRDSYAGSLFQRVINAINLGFKSAGVSSVGEIPPPDPVDTVSVQGTLKNNVLTCPSEILHHVIVHNSALKKGVQYISEISTSPSFSQPHIIDHGSSRSSFITLPTFDNNGIVQQYYLRSYAQYSGSQPAKPTVFGGLVKPTAIVMTGTSKTTLLSSTGSGTASPDGTQGGHGLGKVLDRPAPGPKRQTL